MAFVPDHLLRNILMEAGQAKYSLEEMADSINALIDYISTPIGETSMSKQYAKDPNYTHIPDGQRKLIGEMAADTMSDDIRYRASADGTQMGDVWAKPICPGCYMVAIVHMAMKLAKDNGQPIAELGRSLGQAFYDVALTGEFGEAIEVKLDPTEEKAQKDGGTHKERVHCNAQPGGVCGGVKDVPNGTHDPFMSTDQSGLDPAPKAKAPKARKSICPGSSR